MSKESGSESKKSRRSKKQDSSKAAVVEDVKVVELDASASDRSAEDDAARAAAEDEAARAAAEDEVARAAAEDEAARAAAEDEAARAAAEDEAARAAAEDEAAKVAAEEAARIAAEEEAARIAAEEEAARIAAEEAARAEEISQMPKSDQALFAEEAILAKEAAAREKREEDALSANNSDAVSDTSANNASANVASDNDQPDVPENEKIHRYDLMITSEKPGYKPPKTAIAAMIQQLVFRGYATPTSEAIADNWQEVYFTTGPTAHELFMEKGSYTSPAPVFNEIIFKVSDKAFNCDYSETPKRPLYWGIEICGSRFKMVTAAFKKFFLDAYKLRIAIDCQDAGPAREHKTVAEEEIPVEPKKHERGSGLAGVDVTEM